MLQDGEKRSDVVWIISDIIFSTSDIVFPTSHVVFGVQEKTICFLFCVDAEHTAAPQNAA